MPRVTGTSPRLDWTSLEYFLLIRVLRQPRPPLLQESTTSHQQQWSQNDNPEWQTYVPEQWSPPLPPPPPRPPMPAAYVNEFQTAHAQPPEPTSFPGMGVQGYGAQHDLSSSYSTNAFSTGMYGLPGHSQPGIETGHQYGLGDTSQYINQSDQVWPQEAVHPAGHYGEMHHQGFSPISPEAQATSLPHRNDSVASDVSSLRFGEPTALDLLRQSGPQVSALQGQSTPKAWETTITKVPPIDRGIQTELQASAVDCGSQTEPRAHPVDRGLQTEAKPADESADALAGKYKALQPWYQASLDRLAASLQEEQNIPNDSQKYVLFERAMRREIELRALLYQIDEAAIPSRLQSHSRESPSVEPPASGSVVQGGTLRAEPDEEPQSRVVDKASSATLPIIDGQPSSAIIRDIDINHSPGWRPKMLAIAGREPSDDASTRVSDGKDANVLPTTGQLPRSPGADAPVPVASEDAISNENSQPDQAELSKRTYTPFRYTIQPPKEQSSTSPQFQAYSALRDSPEKNARTIANSAGAFLDIIRQNSTKRSDEKRKDRSNDDISRTRSPSIGSSVKLLSELQILQSVSPIEAHPVISIVTTKLENMSDDLPDLSGKIALYEEQLKSKQADREAARAKRQEASERHVDSLFEEQKIGYPDVRLLDEAFKQSELKREKAEVKQDFEDYERTVFLSIASRLSQELEQLESCGLALDEVLQSVHTYLLQGTRLDISAIMNLALEVSRKTELRHDSYTEASLDRERRRRELDRMDIAKDPVTQAEFEAQSAQFEKGLQLDAAKSRDARINKLMDAFDAASLQCLGSNQDTIDAIMAKAQQILRAASAGRKIGDKQHVFSTLQSSQELIERLTQESEEIMTCFDKADRLLNKADYEVSIANLKLHTNDEASLTEPLAALESEFTTEDRTIQNDLDSKLATLKSAPNEIKKVIDTITVKLNEFVEHEPLPGLPNVGDPFSANAGFAPSTTPVPGRKGSSEGDWEHQLRIKKALEDAKRRNAARHL